MDISIPETTANAEQLQQRIHDYIHQQFSRAPHGRNKDTYFAIVETFPELVFDTLATLRKNPIDQHHSLWLLLIKALLVHTRSLAKLHELLSPLAGSDPMFAERTNSVQPRIHDVIDCVVHLLKNGSIDYVLDQKPYECCLRETFIDTAEVLFAIVSKYPDLAQGNQLMTLSSRWMEAFFNNINTFKYSSWEAKVLAQERSFPMLVLFIKASFFTGSSDVLKPLLASDPGHQPLISELYPCNLIAQTLVLYSDIVDFYRYCAFSMTLVAAGTAECSAIDDRFSDLAHIFYVVLLDLPSLNLSNYRPVTELPGLMDLQEVLALMRGSNQHIKAEERDEISFFYVLNCLLSLRTIQDFVHPQQRFLHEATHFVESFGKRIASDLDVLASSNQSYSSSVLSMLSLEQRSLAPVPQPSSRVLSSILIDGTYKEKLHLVKFFFSGVIAQDGSIANLAKLFNFKGVVEGSNFQLSIKHQELCHITSHIDSRASPGKSLYVSSIEKIIRLLHLLAIDHLHCSGGLERSADATIAAVFHTTYTINDILLVKKILRVGPNGKVERITERTADGDDDVLDQLQLVGITQELDRIIHSSEK